MLNRPYRHTLKNLVSDFLICLIIALIWSIPTFLNQFPLSHYDTDFYLYNAHHLTSLANVIWRPITYSLFIRVGVSLLGFMGFIVLQNLVVTAFVLKLSRFFVENLKYWHFLILSFALFLTPLPYLTNFMMPDAFSALAILILPAVFLCKSRQKWFWAGAAIALGLMHFSNILIISMLTFIALTISLYQRKKTIIVPTLTILVILISLFKVCQGVRKASNYFLFSRFIAYDLVRPTLDTVCPSKDIIFCKDKDKSFYIWGNIEQDEHHSPSPEIYSSVVTLNRHILFSPLFFTYLYKSLSQSIHQVFSFAQPMEIIVNDSILTRLLLSHSQIENFYSHNPLFFNNKLFSLELLRARQALLYFIVFVLSLLALLWLLRNKYINNREKKFLGLYGLTYLLNSLTVGFFAEPMGRYNNKLIWGFSFLLVLFVLSNHSKMATKAKDQSND